MKKLLLLFLPLLLLSIEAKATEALKVPWSLAYSDGSANSYRFGQDGKDAAVTFEYLPVRPENSSTGTYSGGEPKQGSLDSKQSGELRQWVAKFESDKSLRQESRDKGSGAFVIKSGGDDSRSFIIRMSPTLKDFDAFLKTIRS